MLLEIKTLPRKNPTGRGSFPRVCILQCDVCSERYERPYGRSQLEATIHRCSQKCVYGSRVTDGVGGHGAEVFETQCMTCLKPMKLRKVGNVRKWGKTCSRKCYGEYRSQHPELCSVSQLSSEESREKARLTRNSRLITGEIVHPMQGKHHSDETRELMRQRKAENSLIGAKNGMFGRKHSEETRAKMSEKKAAAILEGKFHPYGTRNAKGTYVSIKTGRSHYFKSGWEEAVMKWLDAEVLVTTWDYESVRIPYVYDNHKRWYVPDFTVVFWGDEMEMWEVKPKEFVNSQKNIAKELAARAWCQENDVSSYHVLTGDDLRIRGII